MNSMTGYGRGESTLRGLRAVVECSSVNRKQAELVFSAPRELLALEPKVRAHALSKISRGRLAISLSVESDTGSGGTIDKDRASAYMKEIRALQKLLGLSGAVSVATVLAGPGVVRTPGATDDPWPAVSKALDAALVAMLAMRASEGAHLARVLSRDAKALHKLASKVRPYADKVPARHRTALLARMVRAKLPLDASDPRVVTEIALFAERCDITEELERLESHSLQFVEKLKEDGPIGRTLEFLAQEIGREWNTVGSKASDTTISRFVVEAKALLDKLREQLANIE